MGTWVGPNESAAKTAEQLQDKDAASCCGDPSGVTTLPPLSLW